MTDDVISDIEFNGQITIKTYGSKNKTLDINFEFGTQNGHGQIISFSGTKGKIFLEYIIKSMCEQGLEAIKRQ